MTDDRAFRNVGVIGLGKMGCALADSLLAKGFEVTVWNRTPAKAEPLVKAGAKLALSVAGAARRSDAIVVCLRDYAAFRAALMAGDVGSALRRKILVDVTNMRSEDLRELVAWTEAHGISLLKGSILAYPDDVRAGTCGILYGGARGAFDAIAPLLQAMGGNPLHMGNNPMTGSGLRVPTFVSSSRPWLASSTVLPFATARGFPSKPMSAISSSPR
jgi:3-hydroxyisobutyrate dehydrogenase-like beta-hydroxyacid dehydrogenase